MVATQKNVLPVPGGPRTTVTWCRVVATSAFEALSLSRWRRAASFRLVMGGGLRTRWSTCPVALATSSYVNGASAGSLLCCCSV
eukprot:5719368-Pyramimonas_sp.AAC.1